MQTRNLLHATEQHIGDLTEQISAHRALIRILSSDGQSVRDQEQILEMMIEARALALTHRHFLLTKRHPT